MNRDLLKSVNSDLLKSKVVLSVIGGVIVLLLVWWFAWMSPEGAKLTSVRQQVTNDSSTKQALSAELATLQAEKNQVKKELPYLLKVTTAIPPTEDPPGIVDELNALANQTGCTLSSVNPADTASPSGTPGLSIIPVTFTLSGKHGAVFNFLGRFYTLKRLMTISTIGLGPGGSNANILDVGDGQLYSLSVSASAYTTYVAPVTS